MVWEILKSPQINLPLSGEVPRRGGGGTEAAFSTVLPREASGMIRGFPRRADDICPYGARVVFVPVGEANGIMRGGE